MAPSTAECKSIKTAQLINYLNKVNFQNGSILVNFKHPKYNRIISLHAKPQPCTSSQVECIWLTKTEYCGDLTSYTFINFSMDDGYNQVLVGADVERIGEDGIRFILPENGCETTQRQVKRNISQDIDVQLVQDSIIYQGKLLEFSSASFCVDIFIEFCQSPNWINPNRDVFILFIKQQEVLYSGNCRIIRELESPYKKKLMIEPLNQKIHRFKSKQIRSVRQELTPPPNIIFKHPFTGRIINLNVIDLSGTGLAVEEDPRLSVLLPGMIIPDLGLELMRSCILKCKAQVMYSNKIDDTTLRCGLAILDMNVQDHITLSNMLYRAKEKNSRFSTSGIDIDALWNFFFETGFVYPKKYGFIQNEKERFRSLYSKLYNENPDFARHIIYQEKGNILGHVSMLRTYEKTWMIQHHAAKTSLRNRAGFIVMQLIGRYTNEFHRLRSSNMNFVVCYFRPQSHFPDKAFGDVARKLQDPKACSLDSFAYYYFKKQSNTIQVGGDWSLQFSSPGDLRELENHYDMHSGGLMTEAMHLRPEGSEKYATIDLEYQRLGFKRQQSTYSLKKHDVLKAVFIVLASDVGLNMSDLTNCIHVMIVDGADLEQDHFSHFLNILAEAHYDQDQVSVLVNPVPAADELQLDFDKIYNLWIIDLEYMDFYFQHVDSLLNRRRKELTPSLEQRGENLGQPENI